MARNAMLKGANRDQNTVDALAIDRHARADPQPRHRQQHPARHPVLPADRRSGAAGSSRRARCSTSARQGRARRRASQAPSDPGRRHAARPIASTAISTARPTWASASSRSVTASCRPARSTSRPSTRCRSRPISGSPSCSSTCSACRCSRPPLNNSGRYVVVNIPAASIEAIEDGAVAQRHTAVVGRIDRAEPDPRCQDHPDQFQSLLARAQEPDRKRPDHLHER